MQSAKIEDTTDCFLDVDFSTSSTDAPSTNTAKTEDSIATTSSDVNDEAAAVVAADSAQSRQSKRLQKYFRRKEARRGFRKVYKERVRERNQALLLAAAKDPSLLATVVAKTTKPKRVRMDESPCHTSVVVDCSFDHMMGCKNICKMASQISNMYAFNRRSSAPVQLHLTSLHSMAPRKQPRQTDEDLPEVSVYDRLSVVDCQMWDINMHAKHYTELFPASSIVYLCAESPNVLPDKFGADGLFTSSDVYVIGGLVDHNHHRAHCYTVASEREHRTARLPIAEKGIKLNGRYVLTTMEAFCSLTPVLAGLKDWETSLREAIAPRKLLLAPAGNSTEETLATDEAKAEDEAPDEDVLK